MKIRIYDDSIRLRLDRSEVDQIGAGEAVRCATHFPDGTRFSYALTVGGDAVGACFQGGLIDVAIPHATAMQWASDETAVSIRGEESLAQGELKLLIEKDFECLDPREGEDQSNRFVNPKAT